MLRVVLQILLLAAAAFSVAVASGGTIVPLEVRWRALQANCTDAATHRSVLRVSVADAAALFDSLDLQTPTRARWLLDIGESALLHTGNITRAEQFLRASADLGHAHAQFLMGAILATSVSATPAEASLFFHFAARGGSIAASAVFGHRHLVGYYAPRDCDAALRHYKAVSDDVMRDKHALPNPSLPLQVFSLPPHARLSDDETNPPQVDSEDIQRVEYLRERAAQSSNVELLVRTASLVLFTDLYQADTREDGLARREAVGLLKRAGSLRSSYARALLGHVHAYGLAGYESDAFAAMEQYQTALNASSEESTTGRSEAATGLGLLYLHGIGGVVVDVEQAMANFELAAHAGHAEGVFHAASVMAHANPRKSRQYLEASARVGHVESLFKLARLREKQRFERGGPEAPPSCESIVKGYKEVAEYTPYGRKLVAFATEAYVTSRYDHALRLYLIAAEMGYEVAAHNAAWLIERFTLRSQQEALANRQYLRLVDRGAAQSSPDALVRAGDIEFSRGNYRLAMIQYLRAAEVDPTHARALYSAGYMCERGLGTASSQRNLKRARWYYEQAAVLEPLVACVMWALVAKIDVEESVRGLVTSVGDAAAVALEWAASALCASNAEHEHGVIEFGEGTTPSSAGGDGERLSFEAAMAFNGVGSRIVVDMEAPPVATVLTLESWVWIDASPSAKAQVLLEWQGALRVDLVPHGGGSSWQIRVMATPTSSSPSIYASMLRLTNFDLRSRQWYHVRLAVDVAASIVVLTVGSADVDSGDLLVAFAAQPRRQLVSIGQPVVNTDPIGGFRGQLARFRARTSGSNDGARFAQTIDLRFDLFAYTDDVTGREVERSRLVTHQVPENDASVEAADVELRMVQLPTPSEE